MDVETIRGGPWVVAQWDRFGSCMRWLVAASDRRPEVPKPLSDDPDRQTKEDTALLRGSSSPSPHMMDRCSREVGKSEIIWMRDVNRSPKTPDELELERVTRCKLGERKRWKKGKADGAISTSQSNDCKLGNKTPPVELNESRRRVSLA